MGAELPYQICEIGAICRMWRNTQNTHLPCSPISIHIFLAEGDLQGKLFILTFRYISLVTFLTEGDITLSDELVLFYKISIHTFLTEGDARSIPDTLFRSTISIYTFLTEGDEFGVCDGTKSPVISIHTFLTEDDMWLPCMMSMAAYFNPHLPCGRWRAADGSDVGAKTHFNPHLPCGRWPAWTDFVNVLFYFNPHLPCGRWPFLPCPAITSILFQSTPSLRKVTAKISIIIFL